MGERRLHSSQGKNPISLLSSRALMASLVCILRIVLTTESRARLCRFSLSSAAWDQSLMVICVNSPLPVLVLPRWLWRDFLGSLFIVCNSNVLRL